MAFPTGMTAEEAYFTILAQARVVKQATASQVALAQGGTCSAADILGFLTTLASANAAMQAATGVSGLIPFAQSASGSQNDITTDYNAMAAAIANVVSWAKANFPASGGYLLAVQFNADGSQAARIFTAASLSGYVTQLQALQATIG